MKEIKRIPKNKATSICIQYGKHKILLEWQSLSVSVSEIINRFNEECVRLGLEIVDEEILDGRFDLL